ncbi:MAG: class III signal peptide-containing protein [archaeon]
MDNRGQGALEYLLLIGGAVLIATIVLLIIIGSTDSTEGLINDNLTEFKHQQANAISHQLG